MQCHSHCRTLTHTSAPCCSKHPAVLTVARVLQRWDAEVGIQKDEGGSLDVRREGGEQSGRQVLLLGGAGGAGRTGGGGRVNTHNGRKVEAGVAVCCGTGALLGTSSSGMEGEPGTHCLGQSGKGLCCSSSNSAAVRDEMVRQCEEQRNIECVSVVVRECGCESVFP